MTLELHHVTHRFGRREVLSDLSLRVGAGDIYGLIGHNGAGKSTAMRIGLGLLAPSQGGVLVDGFDARRFPREARVRVGGQIEEPAFQPHWSGRRNLIALARLQGVSDPKRETQARLDLVGLLDAADRPYRTYSQGMKARLALAQAVLGDPSVVLLDEPTNGLDPEAVADLRQLLQSLARDRGAAVLVSSHLLAEMTGLCTRVGIIKEGRLLVESSLDDLLQSSEARYRLETPEADLAKRCLSEWKVEHQPGEREGCLELTLGATSSSDLAARLVDRGVPLGALIPLRRTLEEVYLEVDRAGGAPPVAAKTDAPAVVAEKARPRERRAPKLPILRASRYELGRLFSRWGGTFLLLLPGFLGAGAVWMDHVRTAELARQVAAGELASMTQTTAFDAVARGLTVALPVLAAILVGLASQSVSGEVSRKTARNLFTRPVRRGQWLWGKLIALSLYGSLAYGVLLVGVFGLAKFYFEFSDIGELLPNGRLFKLLGAEEVWPVLREAVRAPLLPLLAYTTLGLSVGTWFRSSASALASALGFFLALDLGRVFLREFGDREGWSLASFLPTPLGDVSFLRFYAEFAAGVSNPSYRFESLEWLTPLSWIACALLLGWLGLRRRAV